MEKVKQLDGERIHKLWVSVIVQAINDITNDIVDINEKEKAKRWIFEYNVNFLKICAWLNLDPEWVREMAKKAIDKEELLSLSLIRN